MPGSHRRSLWQLLSSLMLLLTWNVGARGQEISTPGIFGLAGEDEGRAGTSSGTVGGPNYIDWAVPETAFRLRFDAGDGDNRPNRAGFFYGQYQTGLNDYGQPARYYFDGNLFREAGPAQANLIPTSNFQLVKDRPNVHAFAYNGRGLAEVETNINSRIISPYFEWAPVQRFSCFIEAPVVSINPEINSNAAGLGDINVGFKYALLDQDQSLLTFQWRTYIPTGDSFKGLGTGHVSLEPALLYYQNLTERLALFGEVRDLVPLTATDQAGNVVRYGVGGSWVAYQDSSWWVAPVLEVVGWTVLNGLETVAITEDIFDVRNAAGDTIVNGKVGLRFGIGERNEFSVSYSRALTGDVWYKDLIRLELKRSF